MTYPILPSALMLAVLASPLLLLGTGACKSDTVEQDEQIRQYCENLFNSPSVRCCSAADRAERQFAVRNRYQSAADCSEQLLKATANGRRTFDPGAANACLSHLAGRGCNVIPTAAVRAAEEKAGCNRVVVGLQTQGKACDSSEDCSIGLFCPPVRDTGASACALPAASGEACLGGQPIGGIDHPPCQPNLFCSLIGENPGSCPSPPCLDFRCVPFYEEGESCNAAECGSGLACRDGVCRRGPPSAAGQPCRLSEHCADGLFCDAAGVCAARKANGAACQPSSDQNLVLECTGLCNSAGVCASFCSGG